MIPVKDELTFIWFHASKILLDTKDAKGDMYFHEHATICFCVFTVMKSFQFRLKELKNGLKSVFNDRTEESSAVQYFQVCRVYFFIVLSVAH